MADNKFRPEVKSFTECNSVEDFTAYLANDMLATEATNAKGQKVLRVHLRTSPRKNSFSLAKADLTAEKAVMIGKAVGLVLGGIASGQADGLLERKLQEFSAWTAKRSK